MATTTVLTVRSSFPSPRDAGNGAQPSASIVTPRFLADAAPVVGKIGIRDAVVHKPGALTEAEWAEMHRHPEIGEQIPLASRIVLISDAFHAMTSDRPYRPAMPRDAALAEIERHAGSQFCPHAAHAIAAIAPDSPPAVRGEQQSAEQPA
jgi:HD-GYP domain-containing protein (c-di-GMP phosphodiesterase class II)